MGRAHPGCASDEREGEPFSIGIARPPGPQAVYVLIHVDVATFELAAVGEGTTAPLPIIERVTATGTEKVVVIDPEYVRQMVSSIVKNQDLSRYIL